MTPAIEKIKKSISEIEVIVKEDRENEDCKHTVIFLEGKLAGLQQALNNIYESKE